MKSKRTKQINYRTGALKRRFGIRKGDKTPAGTFIKKANEARRRKVSIMGLI